MVKEPFYGHMAMKIDWIPSEMNWKSVQTKTMGVRIINGGDIQCLYYPPFVSLCDITELYGIIQHEIEHLIRCHCLRIQNRDPDLYNIAADMAVNGKKDSPRIGYKDNNGQIILPLGGNIIWIPQGWDSNQTAEYYYELLNDNNYEPQGNMVDDHEIWDESDISKDEMRQVIKNAVQDVMEKTNGEAPSHITNIIDSLNKPIVKWQQLLHGILGKYVGNKRYTYSRKNRRIKSFGVKGISNHAASEISIIVDTSGSIGDVELKQFFTEIESLSYKSKIWLLQWDNIYRDYRLYRKGDWKKISVKGRGNTDMAAPIDWLIKNNLVKDAVVMLTDGYCNYADPRKINYICILTTNNQYTNRPSWGHVFNLL